MSEPEPPTERTQDWPTHCEQCGTELAQTVIEAVPEADSEHLQTASPGTVVAQDYCPNPACPNRKPGA